MDLDPTPVLRLILAALLSLPIGLEREISGKAAGVRTHLLLASATAGLGWLSITAAEGNGAADPTRIASYTVAGIGFLGAGLIVAVRGRVHGLTTAVAAFTVMAVGLLCGMGYGEVAVALTLISLLTLGPIEWIKPLTYGRFVRGVATMHMVVDDVAHVERIQRTVIDADVTLLGIEFVPLTGDHITVHLTVRGRTEGIEAVQAGLERLSDVAALALVAHTSDLAD